MTIRPTRKHDEEGIRELFKTCFGKELSHEEWLWKYKYSYLGSSSFVAEDGGNIIAHYGGFKMRFYSKGRVFNAYQGCDVMTHPRYRARLFAKRGIIVKTAEAFYEASPTEFIFGFPSERHGRLMSLQLGWEKSRLINVMEKDSDFKADRNPFLKIETGWERIDPQEMDNLWREIRDLHSLSIEKESRYILWRYRDNPQKRYEVVIFRGLLKRYLKAYVIVRMDNNNLSVLDFFVSKEMNFRKVLAALEHFAIKRKAKGISLWVNPEEGIYKILRNAGYRDGKGIPYAVRIFEGSGLPPDFFLDQYCYRLGDYDAA
jgi:hypothetical protein